MILALKPKETVPHFTVCMQCLKYEVGMTATSLAHTGRKDV